MTPMTLMTPVKTSPRARTLILALAMASATLAPPAALAQQDNTLYVIQNARIHTLAGPPIENGAVLIRNGKIEAIGDNLNIPPGAEYIDGTGLDVYPGFFDAATGLGLGEIGQVPATVDRSELGRYNPQLEAYRAIHPSSEHIPVTRANGTTHAMSFPTGGVIPGQGTVIHLDGWTVEEMVIERRSVMVVQWPNLRTRTFDFSTFSVRNRPFKEAEKNYKDRIAELGEWFEAARHYAQATKSAKADVALNRKLEALLPVLDGAMPVLIMANRERQMKDAIEFAEKQGVRFILGGATDAWKIKDLLKEKDVPLILGGTQRLPGHEDEPYDRPFTLPGELHRAGIRFAIATYGSAHARTLPYEAGNAVPYGLPADEALKAITLYPAQILGVSDRFGTLAKGKVANIIVTNGDPLEITTEIRYLFINGKPVSTDNKHKRLYEKYRARP